jgi:methionine biosynthesis protein MetW
MTYPTPKVISPTEAVAERRTDYRIIIERIEPGSRVLDLGCGNGSLLLQLKGKRRITGYGVEISPEQIIECVSRGLSVFQGDLDEGLRDFEDDSFDYVVLNQTLPVVGRPAYLLEEMLRVGRMGIVSFPNFGHWSVRLKLLLSGRMPVSDALPYDWYDTPNIHLLTIRDFFLFCRKNRISILDSWFFHDLEDERADTLPKRKWCMPNLTADYALFFVTRTDAARSR